MEKPVKRFMLITCDDYEELVVSAQCVLNYKLSEVLKVNNGFECSVTVPRAEIEVSRFLLVVGLTWFRNMKCAMNCLGSAGICL
jgi:hypothetical protein